MGTRQKRILFLISCLVVGLCSCAKAITQAPPKSGNMRVDEYGRVLLFMGDPEKYFDDIKDMKNLFFYIGLYDDNSDEAFFENFLSKHFATINKRRAIILVHLFYLGERGYLGYALVDQIIMLFKINPRPFLSVLKKREDWTYFAEGMKVGEWLDFVDRVRSRGNSGFEGKFKNYVLKKG
jgi:hypothetical protein